jgi:hypothetical protein
MGVFLYWPVSQVRIMQQADVLAAYLLGLSLNPKDRSDVFLQNDGRLSEGYMASYPST